MRPTGPPLVSALTDLRHKQIGGEDHEHHHDKHPDIDHDAPRI
jgi:hypothetical protein